MPHTERVFPDLVVDPCRKSHYLCDLVTPTLGDTIVHTKILHKVLLPRKILIHFGVLDDTVHAVHRLHRLLTHIVAANRDLSRLEREEPEDDLDRSRFTRAVRTEKAEYLAGHNIERNIIEYQFGGQVLCQILDRQHGFHFFHNRSFHVFNQSKNSAFVA